MAEGAVITGVVGEIRWAYYQAATIEGYTVARLGPKGSRRWSLRARIVLADTFKLTQAPLDFVALHEHGAWRWRILRSARAGDIFTAELEERP